MPNILHITHPWGGGISTYIEDLRQAAGADCNIYTLKCWNGMLHLASEQEGEIVVRDFYLSKNLKLTDFTNKRYARLLGQILRIFDIDLVHINSAVGHTFDIFHVPARLNIPVVCTMHDFFYICPTFHLVDDNGDYCGLCCHGEENHNCLKNHSLLYSPFSGHDLREFRLQFRAIVESVAVFVFPSYSTKKIFSDFYGLDESACRVLYHGTSLEKCDAVIATRGTRKFRVGILGTMYKHKGKASIQAIIKQLAGAPVEFYHFGDGNLSGPNLTSLGRYDQQGILDLLQSNQIDVMLLLSTWPETFSYTLTETIAANIPSIVTDKGALAERVTADKIGWLVDYRDIEGICALLVRLCNDPSLLDEYKMRVAGVALKSLAEMSKEYAQMYETVLSKSLYANRRAFGSTAADSLPEDLQTRFWQKLFLSKIIKIESIVSRVRYKAVCFFSRA